MKKLLKDIAHAIDTRQNISAATTEQTRDELQSHIDTCEQVLKEVKPVLKAISEGKKILDAYLIEAKNKMDDDKKLDIFDFL